MELLRITGRGCAMASAVPMVKDNAGVIAESNNDAGDGNEILLLLDRKPGS